MLSDSENAEYEFHRRRRLRCRREILVDCHSSVDSSPPNDDAIVGEGIQEALTPTVRITDHTPAVASAASGRRAPRRLAESANRTLCIAVRGARPATARSRRSTWPRTVREARPRGCPLQIGFADRYRSR